MSLLSTLQSGQELSSGQIREFSALLLDEGVSDREKFDLLKALSDKGETAAEITGFVESFLEKARRPDLASVTEGAPTIDVCGTGGDKLDLFNVSTTSMFVIAAGGAKVVKHGNRGITSKSGGSDVLEELGIPAAATDEQLRQALEKANVCFLFAPHFHPAFKAVVNVRKALAEEGIKTIFNLIGPLLNPTSPRYQMVGVTMGERTADFAEILKNLGRKQVFAVTGHTATGESVDEFSNLGLNKLYLVKEGQEVQCRTLSPQDLGLEEASLEDLKGGGPAENAETLIGILSGEITGPRRDIVLLNAGAGLACCQIVESISEGIALAAELIDSGMALGKLRAFQAVFQ